MTIVLSTLNARYSHASLGLRYLYANMGELQAQTTIDEFVIGARTTDLLERLLRHQVVGEKLIIGFGVYIWNVEETCKLVAQLKRVAPEVVIVLGGPEVSYETQEQEIVRYADYVITGWGDVSFPDLCRQILHGPQPLMKIQAGLQPPMSEIKLPYAYYTDDDIKNRTLYVEASRGCPFKCEFCLSALDKTAWPFEIDQFLQELESLHARGARLFKFVDRTFNLNIKTSLKIMQFFLDKLEAHPEDPVFAHFEVVPDHLPEALREGILKFPDGCLQFEIGIQSFNPEVQARISRKQNNEKAADNIRWLVEHSTAHLHVDLIAGLPGETIESFAQGFNQLYALGPHEIQFGILKRLRGTPIIRHTDDYQMRYDPYPPYTILANQDIPFTQMQRLVRFARFWDMIANSGRFKNSLKLILAEQAFENFMELSDWIFVQIGATHKIALDRLANLVTRWLVEQRGMDQHQVQVIIGKDYAGDARHVQSPEVMQEKKANKGHQKTHSEQKNLPKRQARHAEASE
ncbi:radical SAM protein [Undibacterium cyanobacteriorum]|uniref:Radical SAM protein n=1 Tax=Undibacterium cyanobacteriorum TaxID=3073561 RepID=A0ABY9RIH5_9BURK|nr:radical SAM protein [Undibacterium sp. 20NA77.5]WMW81021.1 radical SAM protein [Undibacterium sp. 20NA77.5]